MRHGHVVAIDRIAVRSRDRHAWVQVGDDLVAVEVEIDPGFAAASLGAAQQPAIEGASGGQVMDGEGEMEGAHGT